ncbi:MAG: DUF4395 domain-containing protein [Sulfurimonas sp.]|nr:DUF4395 domain-containing protein [Sulfurimonas sp.]MCK4974855.1 DUF4395 domain-containing protein [Sulfurimonas sp.]
MAKSCPVNFQKVDENQIRVQALLVTLSALGFVLSGSVLFAFLLVYDFIVRLFISQKFSIFSQIAIALLKGLNIPKRDIDSAPKIFASHIGLGFSVAILLTSLFGLNEMAVISAIILAICAALDAFFNYCIGCKCYTILHRLKIL